MDLVPLACLNICKMFPEKIYVFKLRSGYENLTDGQTDGHTDLKKISGEEKHYSYWPRGNCVGIKMAVNCLFRKNDKYVQTDVRMDGIVGRRTHIRTYYRTTEHTDVTS